MMLQGIAIANIFGGRFIFRAFSASKNLVAPKGVALGFHISRLWRSILVISYHLLTRRQPYSDLGANYFDERDRNSVQRRCVKRLEKLGFKVELQPTALAA